MNALIIEDDPSFAERMRCSVERLGETWQAILFRTAGEALDYLDNPSHQVDLGLVDLGLPDQSGIEVIARIKSRFPDIPTMVVSIASTERSVIAAIRAGARGYVLKDDPSTQITDALSQTLQGNYPISPALARYLFKLAGSSESLEGMAELTPKELELLRHLSRGRSYAEAARAMGVAVSTVQTHIRNLYRKLDVHSQVQAVTKAQGRGLI